MDPQPLLLHHPPEDSALALAALLRQQRLPHLPDSALEDPQLTPRLHLQVGFHLVDLQHLPRLRLQVDLALGVHRRLTRLLLQVVLALVGLQQRPPRLHYPEEVFHLEVLLRLLQQQIQ